MKIRSYGIALGVAFSGISLASVPGNFEFSPYESRHVGSWPDSVAIGDVNGDRLEDVVLATSFYFDEANDYHVFIYLQRPDGSLGQPQKFKYGESTNDTDLELADLNGDGIKDVILGYQGGIAAYLFDGKDSFQPRQFAVEMGCHSLATLDIDGDERTDIVCQSWSNGAAVLLGDGKGGVKNSRDLATGASGWDDMKAGDINSDGLPDLVITSDHSGSLFVHASNGQGWFEPEVAYPAPPSIWGTAAVAIGDLDSDGKNEVAVVTSGNSPNSALFVYRQDQHGKLLPNPTQHASYDIPAAILARDIDRDGRTDLLVGHHAWFSIGHYMQGDTGLVAEQLTPSPYNAHANGLAAGDLDDDGCTDVAIADYNSGLVTLRGSNCHSPATESDFNGDGIADLLWHNDGTGESEIWLSADSTAIRAVTRVNSADWRIVATGDFDGDDRADIVWHNQLTGAGTIWKSGNYATQQGLTRITDPAWAIVGTGDYDGDGKDDLLWRHATSGKNAIWKSGNYRTQQAITAVTDVLWQAAGSGDFDGDGRDDILWRHATSGRNAIWRGGDYRHQQAVTAITNVEWNVEAVGDFDGDGLDDLFWRHANGANSIWRAAAYTRQLAVPKQATRWALGASADYDGNGKDDLVWRNSVNGNNLIWRSAASSVVRGVAAVQEEEWTILN